MAYMQYKGRRYEMTEDEAAQLEADQQNSLSEMLPIWNRQKRDGLLAETDWWASSDLTITDEQRSYRQQLRDITDHANWPNLADDDWPTKP